ncbi:hypothetical protein Gasu2_04590 [Galdieria sulphuraria]|nr:hypothetical protein Gasu2_04590 [Galdieria sulphuraria]
MTLFSLRLLRHPVTKDFFAETVETSLPQFRKESIVSGLFIGSVVGEPHSIIKDYGQGRFISPPSCRRFALDLEKQEFLEVSWYLDKQLLLVNWVHFPTNSHCLSYFVIYEAPVPGKLPHKLYKSVEMISQFDPKLENNHSFSLWFEGCSLSKENRSLPICNVPEVKSFFQKIIAAKSGIVRITEYLDNGNSVTVDQLARFFSYVRILQDTELASYPFLQKTRNYAISQLPFIETDNASEGIRQLLHGQQQMNSNEQYSWMPREVTNQRTYKRLKGSKEESTAMKDHQVDCQFFG